MSKFFTNKAYLPLDTLTQKIYTIIILNTAHCAKGEHTMISLSNETMNRVAELTGLNAEQINDEYVNYEWDNMSQHERWIVGATAEEIAAWINDLLK